jgi:hypothetical protein
MNLPPDHRQLQQTQQQKQKTLIIKKQENILDFNSRLIEALVAGRPSPETPRRAKWSLWPDFPNVICGGVCNLGAPRDHEERMG